MAGPKQSRLAPSVKGSKADRDTSKSRVTQDKAQQKIDLARKAFENRRKVYKKQLADAYKLQKDIDKMIKAGEDKERIERQFLGQVKKYATQLKALEKQLKADQVDLGEHIEKPQTLTATVRISQKPLTAAKPYAPYGEFAVSLAVVILILKWYLEVKFKKR